MDNRYTIIKDMVLQAIKRLRENDISVSENDVENMVSNYNSNSELSLEQIRRDIEKSVKARLVKKEIEESLSTPMDNVYDLQRLSVQHKGITLNNQDIDLMMIATSETVEELRDVLNKVSNIKGIELVNEEDFLICRQMVFDEYLNSLVSRNEFILNPQLELIRKIDYLRKSGVVSQDEMEIVNRVISENKDKGNGAIVDGLISSFSLDRVHEMLLTIRDLVPVEKEGVKNTTIEFYRRLFEQIKYEYDSITLDEEGKYGKVILQDGTFDSRVLRKNLDFARSMNKKVRINTLFFYMDCPDDIYKLEEGYSSAALAKEKLGFYISEMSKIMDEYSDVIRSVDVFNELLNRHPLDGDVLYLLRGDISQDSADDNTKSGWLKHLSVEDICDVLAVAREKLHSMDFMYNDDFFTDPNKIPATIELVRRIQDYSKGLGVNLIDSIGTQMHIDNDVSKEEIRNMFISLSQFGLPIEITEFDLAMTSGVSGLTDEKIEFVRQKKINEIYEVIEELKDKCNIRGFTIWSKTDSQNFRVHLVNEELLRNGEEPIKTLHGGVFTEDMVPKSAVYLKSSRKQNFNYHGHTSRCGHASCVDDSSYVLSARNIGMSKIGFTDHVPYTTLEYWIPTNRMHVSEVEDYISSINKLQKENLDMSISCGFEAEYSKEKEGFLCCLRDKCDYMILGQHYVTDGFKKVSSNDPNYPMNYAYSVCQAMDSGIFDIVAHPDIFMEIRDNFTTDDDRNLFMKNAKDACYMICKKAKELGIPLEINTAGLIKGKLSDGHYSYPHPMFWDVAREVGSLVIYGADAHFLGQIASIDSDRKEIGKVIDISKLNLVSDDYDVVLARQNNEELQKLYEDTKSKSVTYETALISGIIECVDINPEIPIKDQLDNRIFVMKEILLKEAKSKKKAIAEKIDSISDDKSISSEDRVKMLAQAKFESERINQTISERKSAFDRASESIEQAQELGCSTKEEYCEVVSYLTETKTQTELSKVMDASRKIDNFSENKKNVKNGNTNEVSKEKVYTHASSNANKASSSSDSNGYVGSINLALIIWFLILISLILALMFF